MSEKANRATLEPGNFKRSLVILSASGRNPAGSLSANAKRNIQWKPFYMNSTTEQEPNEINKRRHKSVNRLLALVVAIVNAFGPKQQAQLCQYLYYNSNPSVNIQGKIFCLKSKPANSQIPISLLVDKVDHRGPAFDSRSSQIFSLTTSRSAGRSRE